MLMGIPLSGTVVGTSAGLGFAAAVGCSVVAGMLHSFGIESSQR